VCTCTAAACTANLDESVMRLELAVIGDRADGATPWGPGVHLQRTR
jgi:hypothetical protein